MERYILGSEVLTISDLEPTAGQVEVHIVHICQMDLSVFVHIGFLVVFPFFAWNSHGPPRSVDMLHVIC